MVVVKCCGKNLGKSRGNQGVKGEKTEKSNYWESKSMDEKLFYLHFWGK
jgi:hypothetical protein